MAPSSLSLIVIRATDFDQCRAFYDALGCEFTKHSHGSGPEHYARELGGVVFEIYPLSDWKLPTTGTRLGFNVANIDSAVEQLVDAGGKLVRSPTDSEWGRRAIVDDPEGHRVEIVKVK